jgi:hypothetical protein
VYYHVAMQMEYLSFWHLVKNSPEWVGVFANGLFAATTIGVIVWQVRVMKTQTRIMAIQVRVMRWQGHVSARHERIQNRLIHLQHEHEWLLRLNAEREQILKLARKMHLAAGCLNQSYSGGDKLSWEELLETVHELNERLRILDISAYGGAYDKWYERLTEYVDAVQKITFEDGSFSSADTHTPRIAIPSSSTRKALQDADIQYKPIEIFLDLEAAIRMEFFEFKKKWDAALPS